MGSTPQQIIEQVSNALKEVCDFRIKDMEESYQRRVVDLETSFTIVTEGLRTFKSY